MHLLYHWTATHYGPNMAARSWFHLNQRSRRMQQIQPGESLWAFTRVDAGRYHLAAELVVRGCTLNNPDWSKRYGPYRVWGELTRSAYFDVARGVDVTPLLRTLSIAPSAEPLGRSFQGGAAVRPLTPADHQALSAFAEQLPLDYRVHPRGQRDVARYWLAHEHSEESSGALEMPAPVPLIKDAPPQTYTTQVTRHARDRQLVLALQDLYEGRCQVCAWSPRSIYAASVCEGHHIQWLTRGGLDDADNLVLLCPNHHRAVHATDALFDFEGLRFDFGPRVEPLQLNIHLKAAG